MALKRWLWILALANVSLYLIVVALVLYVWLGPARETSRLAKENRHRTKEIAAAQRDIRASTAAIAATQRAIQRSRLHSCRQNYDGLRLLFQPFLNRPGQTAQERDDEKKFTHRIDLLKGKCAAQTSTKGR